MTNDLTGLRVAVVHDWLTNIAGAEKVVFEILKIFPKADVYTSVYRSDIFRDILKGHKVYTSFLQKIPLARHKHQLFPVLRRYAFENFDFSNYDLVISSSTAEAKGIITSESTLHVSYIHTPTRYFWSHYDQYLSDPGFGALDPAVRFQLRRTIKSSRRWDFAAAQRPDVILANSATVQGRIQRYYKRQSEVVYPPVDIDRFAKEYPRPKNVPDSYFVVASRLIPYKRFDIAIKACMKARRHLVVVGSGSELTKLKGISNEMIQFMGHVSDEEMVAYVQHAEALIFPGEEDFGIVPVESMAAGTPVIAYAAGGATETVEPGKTGELIGSQSVAAFYTAVQDFNAKKYSAHVLSEYADKYRLAAFRDQLQSIICHNLNELGSFYS